jgi:hypothetical protein
MLLMLIFDKLEAPEVAQIMQRVAKDGIMVWYSK